MRKPAIASLVYIRLFPTPKATDPATFQAHVTRNIVQEVRAETTCYYGAIDCLEAQYPGLDYTNPAHRSRLTRFAYHRRMFRVFDELRLTPDEIQDLCRWEGTKSAREKYEKDHSCTIRDTTWDDVEVEPPRPASAFRAQLHGAEDNHLSLKNMDEDGTTSVREDDEVENSDADDIIEEDDSEDELQRSIGVDLNRHLLAATAARARGEQVVLDADWEQWLKEAAERGASEAASLAGVGSSQGAPNNLGLYGQQMSPLFRSTTQQQLGVLSAPQYAAYSATTSSTPPAGTAM
ncbi:MAG: hypothetical protein HETSPECPRED_009864 [Heterodermia speciosa]|uniref:Uncharacterized protein n=1 Tax=Heterodermia speciosa TaxID=116794 RepID=A0A8H3IPM4_9LECA|nr:MAG: hypothetical protein HETSPECPRED_009864 [Heterodermia speciosa]